MYQSSDADDLKAWMAFFNVAIEESLNHSQPAKEYDLEEVYRMSPSTERRTSETAKSLVEVLRLVDSENSTCADCSNSNPDWASINLGILLCIECSGIHRGLGTHVSKVRSLVLDTSSWTEQLVGVMLAIGNKNSNKVSIYYVSNPRSMIRGTLVKEEHPAHPA